MKAEDHTKGVGAIVTNLQPIETVLRYFLAKMNNEVIEFPKVGGTTVKLRLPHALCFAREIVQDL